jgi:hypothetical protein
MNRLSTASLLAAGFASLAAAADITPAASVTKSNVIVILSDDVGWAEFGGGGVRLHCRLIAAPIYGRILRQQGCAQRIQMLDKCDCIGESLAGATWGVSRSRLDPFVGQPVFDG